MSLTFMNLSNIQTQSQGAFVRLVTVEPPLESSERQSLHLVQSVLLLTEVEYVHRAISL